MYNRTRSRSGLSLSVPNSVSTYRFSIDTNPRVSACDVCVCSVCGGLPEDRVLQLVVESSSIRSVWCRLYGYVIHTKQLCITNNK